MLPVAIISIDDANITNLKTDVEKILRANKKRTGAHNAMSNKEWDVHNAVLDRNKDGQNTHKSEVRNDLEESGCSERSVNARSQAWKLQGRLNPAALLYCTIRAQYTVKDLMVKDKGLGESGICYDIEVLVSNG